MLLCWLHDLGEDPARRGGVKEGHPRSADPGAGRVVDEAHPGRGARVQRGLHRLDPVGHVVQSRPPAAQELAERRLGAKGLEELDVAVADIEQLRVDALLGHGLAVDEWHAELVAVERERIVDALDGDAHVVDGGQHGAAEDIDPANPRWTVPARRATPRWAVPARRASRSTPPPGRDGYRRGGRAR